MSDTSVEIADEWAQYGEMAEAMRMASHIRKKLGADAVVIMLGTNDLPPLRQLEQDGEGAGA